MGDNVMGNLSKKRKLSQMNEDNIKIKEFKKRKKPKIVNNKLLPFEMNQDEKNKKFDFGFKPRTENVEKQKLNDNEIGIVKKQSKKKKKKRKSNKKKKRI